jgi:periodic tryptophan protein 2
VQTGKLVDVLTGHTAPISATCFNGVKAVLASGAWDQKILIWDVYNSGAPRETLTASNQVIALAFSSDGNQMCAATLDSQLTFWETDTWGPMGSIEGARDILGGRSVFDKMTLAKNTSQKHFTAICFSPDNSCIIAAGNSPYICLYEISEKILLKKFQISRNMSLDGVMDFLGSRGLKDVEPIEGEDDVDSDLEYELSGKASRQGAAVREYTPGAQSGDLSHRRWKPQVRSKSIAFAPTGRAFSAVTTEGLLVFSIDESFVFDPFDLDVETTPQTTWDTLKQGQPLKALVMALKLGLPDLLEKIFHQMPPGHVTSYTHGFPAVYLPQLLAFLAVQIEKNVSLELYLVWVVHLLWAHGDYVSSHLAQGLPVLRGIMKAISKKQQDILRLCDDNRYMLEFILQAGAAKRKREEKESTTFIPKDTLKINDTNPMLEEKKTEESLPGWGEATENWSDEEEIQPVLAVEEKKSKKTEKTKKSKKSTPLVVKEEPQVVEEEKVEEEKVEVEVESPVVEKSKKKMQKNKKKSPKEQKKPQEVVGKKEAKKTPKGKKTQVFKLK